MDRQDILIRLLKEGHITEEEFKLLYEPIDVARNGFWQPVETYPSVTKPTFKHQWVPEWSPICVSYNTTGTTITTN